jgi:3-deoxy-D-arabino-heptulosonate 7-phosphate (DAHP) synthase class II
MIVKKLQESAGNILWYADPLLGNDSKLSNYTTASTKTSVFLQQYNWAATEE